MEAPMEGLFNSLKCVQCKKYLSILPVRVYPDKSVKCGRCSSGTDAGIDSKVYEHIVENLKFPCINLYEGCSKLLIPAEMKIHEEICIKSKVTCPVCEDEQFTDGSLLMVEHFKEKHSERFISDDPSVMLKLNLKKTVITNEIIYLYVNSSLVHMIAKIIRVRYNNAVRGLNVDLADIGKSFQPGNFELSNIQNKSIHKSETGYFQIDLNEFPDYIVMCKIPFESSDNNKKEIVSKKLIKVPVLQENRLFQAATLAADKTLNVELEFSNIFLLPPYKGQKTDILYLAGTSWYFGIQRNVDKNDLLSLNCCLEKKHDPIQNKYSFQLNGTIGIRAIASSTAQEIEIEKPVTDRMFGKRSQESMSFTLSDVIRWRNGFNPQIADLSKSKYSIKVSLNLQLTGIYIHEKSCKCSGCVPDKNRLDPDRL